MLPPMVGFCPVHRQRLPHRLNRQPLQHPLPLRLRVLRRSRVRLRWHLLRQQPQRRRLRLRNRRHDLLRPFRR